MLYYFVLGIIFALVIQPIFDGIIALILSFFEMLKGRIAIDIAKSNQKVENYHQENSVVKHNPIGFILPEPEEEEEDYE